MGESGGRLTIVFDHAGAEGASAAVERVLGAWPVGGAIPVPSFHSIEEFADHAMRESLVAGPGTGRVILAVASNLPSAGRMIAALGDAAETTLLLVGGAGGPGSIEAPEGFVLRSAGDDPATLAAMLFGLTRSQRAIERLQQELRVAVRSSDGVAGLVRDFNQEMHLAAQVQRDMLPKRMPPIEGFDAAVLFRPAGFVSGDIFDVRRLDDRRVSFFLADAVGHGVPAALLTMIIGQSLAQARTLDAALSSPGRVLAFINDAMCERETDTPRFATAVYGVLDVDSGEMTIAGAGHPSPLLLSEGETIPAETSGPLLGIFAGAEFDEFRTRMRHGQTLLVYSDGFETAFPKGEPNAEGRMLPSDEYLRHLSEMLTITAGNPSKLESRIEALTMLLDRQAGSLHQADDQTALVLARRSAQLAQLAA